MKPKTKPGRLAKIYSEELKYGISVIGIIFHGQEIVTLPESYFEKDKEENVVLPEVFQKADGYSKYKRDEISFYLYRKGQEEKYICFYPSSFISYYNLKHELCELIEGKFIPI